MNALLRIASALICTALLASAAVPARSASTLSKSQYISLWTSACLAGGGSSKLKLSNGEHSEIDKLLSSVKAQKFASEVVGVKTPPLSKMASTACSCMARNIAARKPNVMLPTSRAVASAAAYKCKP